MSDIWQWVGPLRYEWHVQAADPVAAVESGDVCLFYRAPTHPG
ncbi:hypothetical protein [Komagataeibacter xylinus]|nr:hypothetical protein [Komagataeibacter xylinus]